ncbi:MULTISPECIES: hypothetical protein [Micromonospora]|nr:MULTISPECIES: hypothetical protein [Micromonospora]MCX5120541.1 hypothetical protein [Micromonospora sp. NBC_00362]WTI07504.1 hypothetical protein OHB44_29670 [Micromonospora sp. NBC_00821]
MTLARSRLTMPFRHTRIRPERNKAAHERLARGGVRGGVVIVP